MDSKRYDEIGVSPVIAVILMVSITVILAGVVAIWVVEISGSKDDDSANFILNVRLDSSNDEIHFMVESGDMVDTTQLLMYIDDIPVDVPVRDLPAGLLLILDSPIDLLSGEDYQIKIVYMNQLKLDESVIAATSIP